MASSGAPDERFAAAPPASSHSLKKAMPESAASIGLVFATKSPVERPSVVLAAHSLSKTYRMGEVDVHALRGVEFALHRSELLVLLGRRAAESRHS